MKSDTSMINITTMMTRCLSPLLLTVVTSSLAFSVTAHAESMYIKKSNDGQILLTNRSEHLKMHWKEIYGNRKDKRKDIV